MNSHYFVINLSKKSWVAVFNSGISLFTDGRDYRCRTMGFESQFDAELYTNWTSIYQLAQIETQQSNFPSQ